MITETQREAMLHCLGLDWKKKPFRNYYCEYEPNAEWEDLVNKGLAKRNLYLKGGMANDLYYYHVTTKGKEILFNKTNLCEEECCTNKAHGINKISEVKSMKVCLRHYREFVLMWSYEELRAGKRQKQSDNQPYVNKEVQR